MSDTIVESSKPTPSVELEVKLPPKEKKPRTDAQKTATAKAFEALKARREAKAVAEKDLNDAKELAKEKVRHRKKKESGIDLVTKKDLEEWVGKIKTMIPASAASEATAVEPAVPAAAPVQIKVESQLPKIKEVKEVKEPKKPAPPKKLTGHELLDSLFFNK
jgi:hypothetical protein